MGAQKSLVGVLVVLVIVAGVGGYFAGSSAVPPPKTITSVVTQTVTTTAAAATVTITSTVTLPPQTITVTVTPTPTPTRTITPPPPTPPSHWPKELVYRSASIGSANYVLSGAMSSLIEKMLGIKISVQPGSTTANTLAVANGEIELGLSYTAWIPCAKDPVLAAKIWDVPLNLSNVKYVLGPLDRNMMIVTKRPEFPLNSIKEVADYIKKGNSVRIAFAGSPRGFEDVVYGALLEYYGVREEDIKRSGSSIVIPGEAKAIELLIEGKVDVVFDITTVPSPNYIQLESRMPEVRTISLTDEDINYILNTLKLKDAVDVDIVPKGFYKFLTSDYRTIFAYTIIVARADLPSDLIYQIVRVICENKEYLVKAVSSFEIFDPSTSWKFSSGLDIHPGAKQYYLDAGFIKESK